MARTSTHHHHLRIHLLHCFPATLFILPLLLQAATAVVPTQKGFTLELIHPYSDRSPFRVNRNLTHSQLLQRLIEQSRSRVQWLESANTTTLHTPLIEYQMLYMVELSIGTGRGLRTFHLFFDTGGWLTWIRCKPCDLSSRPPGQLFDPDLSPTYVQLKRDNPLCSPPIFHSDPKGKCAYQIHYNSGETTNGILSKETFAFQSDRRGRPEVIPNVAFGCTHTTTMIRAGIIGMGHGQVSFPNQLPDSTRGRFSYCLAETRTGASGFLRFGDDFPTTGRIQRTPIRPVEGHAMYYVILNGISFGDRRLDLPPETFASRAGDGGSVFDTGSTATHLIQPAYDEVLEQMIRFYAAAKLRWVRDPVFTNLDVCFEIPRDPIVLPHMTLHLEGADYLIGPEKLFLFNTERGSICWAMLRSNRYTIIGAHQQYNIRFSYDLRRNTLSFVPENCAQSQAGELRH